MTAFECRPWVRFVLAIVAVLLATAAAPTTASAQCQNAVTRISPCGAEVIVSPGATNQHQTFTVYDLTAKGQSFAVTPSCTGYVTSCSASPTTANINPNSSTPITVTYSVANTGGSGQVSLSGNSVTGYIAVNSQHRPAIVTLPYYNYDNVQPSLCAADCFDKVLTYTTPADYTLDTPRAVTLMYRSNTANPMVTVQVDAWDSSTVRPAKMSIKVHRPASQGGAFVTFTNGSNEIYFQFDTTIIPERLAAQFAPQLGDTLTGAYNYTAVVTSYWNDSTVLSDSTSLRVLIENERSSVFGAGWTVAGQQTVHLQTDSSLVITDGAGAISWFQKPTGCANPCTYTSPTGDYTTVTSPSAVWYQWGWDRKYPDGTIVSFFAGGPEVAVTDPRGNRALTFYYWNSLGFRDSLITDALGHSFHFVYDNGSDGWESGSIRQIYDDAGPPRYTWFGVDNNNNQDQIEDPMGGQYGGIILAVDAVYNAQHQMISNIDRHQTPWHFGYDFAGKLAADSAPAVLANGVTQPIITHYQSPESSFLINPSSGVGTSTSPGGFEGGGPWWANIWDPDSNHTAFTVDRWGQPLTLNDAVGGTTLYNRVGGAYTIGIIPAIQIYYPQGGVDQFRYNSSGLLTWSEPAGQDSTRYAYGNNFAIADTITGSHQASQVTTVDGHGNVTAVTVAGTYTTHFYVDSRGRDTMIVDPLGHSTSYHYDSVTGNLDSTLAIGNRYTKRTFDSYGRVAQAWANATPHSLTTFDALNRLQTVASGVAGDTTRYFYDSLYMVRVQDAKGQVYRDSVNALGWRVHSYDPDSTKGHVSYAYDRNGNVLTYTNRRNQSVTFTYDPLGRPLSKGGTGVVAATYTYSSNRRVVTGSNAVAATTQYYSSTGWLDSVVTSFPGAGQTFRLGYGPTPVQQLASIIIQGRPTAPSFAMRTYVWDTTSAMLVAAVTNTDTVALGYDGDAQVETMNYGGGAAIGIRRNGQHLIDSTRFTIPYGGRPPTPTPLLDSAFARAYGYDSIGRVINQVFLNGAQRMAAHFGYNTQGPVNDFKITSNVTCSTADSVYGYTCTAGGSSVVNDTAFSADLMANDTVISANGTAIIHATYAKGNRVLTYNGSTFTTDLDGNIIRRLDGSGRDMRFGWSPDGLLVSDTTEGNGHVMQYDYDAFGQLVRRTSGGTVQNYFLWNGSQLLSELDGTATHVVQDWTYLPGQAMPVATINTAFGTIEHPQYDALGNYIGAIYDDTLPVGHALGEGVFDPYGRHIYFASNTGWKGMLWEGDSTQLYYGQSRWYDPYQGRWLSQDPVGVSGGLNLYAYAGGDRVNGFDPSGLKVATGGCGVWCEDGGGGGNGGSDDGPDDPVLIQGVNVTAQSSPWLFDLGDSPLWGPSIADQYFGPASDVSGGGGSSSPAQPPAQCAGLLRNRTIRAALNASWNRSMANGHTEQGFFAQNLIAGINIVNRPGGAGASIGVTTPPPATFLIAHVHPNWGPTWTQTFSPQDIAVANSLQLTTAVISHDSLFIKPYGGPIAGCQR